MRGIVKRMVNWRAYGLDLKDYEIFLNLKENPLQSNASIGRKVNLSSEAVRSRIMAMKEKGFLRANRTIEDPILGARLQTEANGVYQQTSLGLVRQHVVLKGIPDRNALDTIRSICDRHPYTHYRVPAYGQSASLYIQFDLPPEASAPMRKLYDEIEMQGLCTDSIVIDERHFSLCNANFTRWDLKRDLWQVGPREELKTVRESSDLEDSWTMSVDTSGDFEIHEIQPKKRYQFDKLDMQLLRELTINSKPVLTKISEMYAKNPRLPEDFKKDATTLSRRVSRLREHIVTRNRLYYDRQVFDLTYPQLIYGVFKKKSGLTPTTLHHFIQSGMLPFETAVFSDTRTFLIYSTTPPSVAPDLSELIWNHAQEISVFQLQLDASRTYFFYHENFVDDEWRADSDYLLNQPLAVVR